MSEMMGHVAHLAQDIGPRPAGTEEERTAAEYISEQINNNSGLAAEIEDFEAPFDTDLPRAIYALLAVVVGVVGLLVPAAGIVVVVFLLFVAALTLADYFGKPALSRLMPKGASQNVVAKYEPAASGQRGRRSRKVILVAHYDSGKVRAEVNSPLRNAMRVLRRCSFFAIPALFVLMLIRVVPLGSDTGAASSVFNFLIVVAIILSAISLVAVVLHKTAKYNDAANANASGTAALIELAERVGLGRYAEESPRGDGGDGWVESEAEFTQQDEGLPVIHGKRAAQEIFGGDVEISYEAATTVDSAMPTGEISGLGTAFAVGAAGMAGAAGAVGIAGAAEAQRAQSSFEMPGSWGAAPQNEEGFVVEQAAGSVQDTVGAIGSLDAQEQVQETPSVPSWYLAAQKKAKRVDKPADEASFRSRYTVAMEAAEAAREAAAEEPNQEQATQQDISVIAHDAVEEQADGEAVAAPEADANEHPTEPTTDDLISGEGPNLRFNRPDLERAARPERASRDRIVVSADEDWSYGVQQTIPNDPNQLQMPEQEVDDEPGVGDFVGEVTSQMPAAAAPADDLSLSRRIPRISASMTGSFLAVGGATQQRAPLADADSKETAKSLLSMLPSIDLSNPTPQANDENPRLDIPQVASEAAPAQTKSSDDAGIAGATGKFTPVTDEMVQNAKSEEDLFLDDVEDVDESGFQENFTDSGAYAGPDYVEMPKSRVRDLFGKVFGRHKEDQGSYSQQTWDDEGYDDFDDPRRGETYGNDYNSQGDNPYDFGEDFDFDDYPDDQYEKDGQRFNGGAFSALKDRAADLGGRVRDQALSRGGRQTEEDVYDASQNGGYEEEFESEDASRASRRADRARRRPAEEEGAPRRRRFSDSLPVNAFSTETVLPAETEQVDEFRNPAIATEVWFVALGGELAGNAGMNAFLLEHKDELRGAMIVELDAIGAGELSTVVEEGALKTVKFSSRAKRLARKATQATGVKCGAVSYTWCDSAAACATKQGYPAMHLVGDMDGKPAYFAEADDVIDVVDEDLLNENTDFVMELIRAASN